MEIRPAILDDLGVCIDLVKECVGSWVESFPIMEDLLDHMNKDGRFFFVVSINNLVVGLFYGKIERHIYTGERYATDRLMFVQRQFRHTKIVEALVNTWISWAKENGCAYVQGKTYKPRKSWARLLRRWDLNVVGEILERRI